MKINKREQLLLGVTIGLVVLGLTYVLAAPLFRRWNALGALWRDKQTMHQAMVDYIAQRPQWEREYAKLRTTLGESDVRYAQTSDVLKKIEEVGAAAGIQINARRPLPMVDKGVYRELPVQCSFEGATDALVKFLHTLQFGSGFVSVEQLQIYPRTDSPGLLRCDIQIRALAGKGDGP
jgi:Tfp pilus assembly protein PilO